MSASDTPVHTCSYSCQRPECMNAQRAELLAKLAAQAVRMRELEAALKDAADALYSGAAYKRAIEALARKEVK